MEAKRAEINLLFDDLPQLSYFENLKNNVSADIFFETLICCIKNNVLSHQTRIIKLRNLKKKNISETINNLKREFNFNSQTILRLERELSEIVESELKEELALYKNYECINNSSIYHRGFRSHSIIIH